MTHQLATGRTATLIKLAFAAGAKVFAALAAFALTALVTRNMPNDEAGLFLLGFTLLAVLSIFFRLGLDNVILRFLSAHGTDDFAQEKLNRGLLWIATATIPATILGVALSEPIATHVFNKPNFAPILFWMLPALPAMALFFLLSFAFQAQHRVVLTTLFQNLGISTIFIAGFGYLLFNQPKAINAIAAGQAYTVSAIIVFIAANALWFSQRNIRFTLKGYKDPVLTKASMNLWVAVSMSLVIQWSGILVSGAKLSATDVALLSSAHRTALLISFILLVTNMVVAPRYARHWIEKDYEKIEKLAKWSTRLMVIAILPVTIGVIVYPENIMGLFGVEYVDSALLLVILAIGQFVNVATGSVGYLLNMSGHESDYRNVTLTTALISIFMIIPMINMYGVIGAALTTSFCVIIQSLGAAFFVKKRLGFYSC